MRANGVESQQVTTHVHGNQEAGYHEVKVDASGISSEVYLYRSHAGTYVETRKLLLLRSVTLSDANRRLGNPHPGAATRRTVSGFGESQSYFSA